MLMSNGTDVRVGWAPHELIWIKAANSLCGQERETALRDIADMAGRGYHGVVHKARYLRKIERDDARAALRRFLGSPHGRHIMVVGCRPGPKHNAASASI